MKEIRWKGVCARGKMIEGIGGIVDVQHDVVEDVTREWATKQTKLQTNKIQEGTAEKIHTTKLTRVAVSMSEGEICLMSALFSD